MSENFTEGVGPSFEICVACGQTVGDKLEFDVVKREAKE